MAPAEMRSRARRGRAAESRSSPVRRRGDGSRDGRVAASPGSQSAAFTERRKKNRSSKRNLSDGSGEDGRPAKKILPPEDEASACSSPLYEPYIPRVVIGFNAKGKEIHKPIEYRQMNLCTLKPCIPPTCLVDPKLLHIRESSTGTVLRAAKFVMGLSSSIDGNPLSQCSGFIVDWDDKSKTGIIMTSALLICKKSSHTDDWKYTSQYASDAQVVVHFVDGTTVEGEFLYCQEHYKIAFYKIVLDKPTHLPSFNKGVKWAEEVFILGRDGSSHLRISHGRVQYLNAHVNERHHYMYIHGVDAAPELWKKFHYIPRPHLQLKLWGIKFLEPAHIEIISCKCNIDDGLIVEEVSAGSCAERLGVRVGDIIECFNGKCISSTVELENMLLQILEDRLDEENSLVSTIDIEITVYHTRKGVQSTLNLTANLSDKGEVVAIYPSQEKRFIQVVQLTKQIQTIPKSLPRVEHHHHQDHLTRKILVGSLCLSCIIA
uniref:PDZ domain-containing protein n=1 Tax=Oryza punctata TaxID=4537 RepID=A0A0E0KYF3_ORYPU